MTTLDAKLLDFYTNTGITQLQNMSEWSDTLQVAPDQHLVAALVIAETELERINRIRGHILAIIAERGLDGSAVEQLKMDLGEA